MVGALPIPLMSATRLMAFLAQDDQFDLDQCLLNAKFAQAIEGWQANSGQEENAKPSASGQQENVALRRMWKNWFRHIRSLKVLHRDFGRLRAKNAKKAYFQPEFLENMHMINALDLQAPAPLLVLDKAGNMPPYETELSPSYKLIDTSFQRLMARFK